MRADRHPRSRRPTTWWVALAVAVALGASGLSGCTVSTSSADARTLVLGSSAEPTMQMAAHIYRAVLAATGSAVSPDVVVGDDAAQLAAMGAARRDLFPAFTGRLLSSLVPPGPAYATRVTPAAADFDPTYVALNKALPQGVSLADPTMVTQAGLADAASTIQPATDHTADQNSGPSQQLVPVYRNAALSREQAKTINKVAGELTAGDLLTLTRDAARTGDPATLAARWVVTHGLTH